MKKTSTSNILLRLKPKEKLLLKHLAIKNNTNVTELIKHLINTNKSIEDL
jgi:hypothetical protein